MQALSILVGIVLVAGVVTSAFLLWCVLVMARRWRDD